MDGTRGRLLRSAGMAAATTAVLLAFTSATTYRRTVRGARARLFPGAVVETGFGQGEMLLRHVFGESRVSYRSIRSVAVRGAFVFLRFEGSSVLTVYPRALFPDEALARILAWTGKHA